MSVLGVAGLPCSGKSLAAEMIASGEIDGERAALLKADDIGHEILLRPDVAERLAGRFGVGILDAGDPAAARRLVAERVFASPADLEWLESLVHPLVAAETLRRIEAADGRAVVEAALLFAAGMDRRCDRVLIVEADFDVRLARAASRGWDENELRRRERRLLPLFAAAPAGKAGGALARVDNNGSTGALRDALRALLDSRPGGTFLRTSTKGTS